MNQNKQDQWEKNIISERYFESEGVYKILSKKSVKDLLSQARQDAVEDEQLKSFIGGVKWILEGLKNIGGGSGRIVYTHLYTKLDIFEQIKALSEEKIKNIPVEDGRKHDR